MASPVTDFTAMDFDSIKAAMTRYAQEKYGNEGWTDFNEDQFAMMLLELFAYMGDLAMFQINALTKETIATLATREQNLRRIAQTLDYQVPTATAATGQVTLTLEEVDLPYTLPSTFQFGTEDAADQVIFQPKADTLIVASPAIVDVVEGTSYVDELVATSDGTVNQKHPLANSPFISDTLTLMVGGIQWSAVTNLANAAASDQVFLIETDEEGITSIVFGDGVVGQVPASGVEIRATYKVGGGARGNVAKNTITQVVTSSTTVLTVTNEVKTSGGADKPSTADIKRALPASFSVLGRVVNDDDFANFATSIAGVAKAKSEDSSLPNQINLYVAPTGGGSPSATLKNSIARAFKPVKMIGSKLRIGDPYYQDLRIVLDLYVESNARQSDVKTAVTQKLLSDFDFDRVSFGGLVALQNLYLLLEPDENPGVDRVVFRRVQGIPQARVRFGTGVTGNGDIPVIYTHKDVDTLQWNVEVIDTVGGLFVNVQKLVRGRITDLSDTTLTDLTAGFEDDELVGKTLIPDEKGAQTFTISGNTESQITVASGLLNAAVVDETYAVILGEEEVQLADTEATGPAVGNVIPVSSSDGFGYGDEIAILNASSEIVQYGIVASVAVEAIEVETLTAAIEAGYSIVRLYVSEDSTFKFGMRQGSTGFAAGDKWFIDSFAYLGDVQIRDQDIVQLTETNLEVRAIGGIEF